MLILFRYSQGTNSVTTSQLPAESDDSREFKALKTITRSQNDLETLEFDLESHSVNKETDHVDPITWFGILVPQSLRTARERYAKALELSIQSANIEQRLKKNCELIKKLKVVMSETV